MKEGLFVLLVIVIGISFWYVYYIYTYSKLKQWRETLKVGDIVYVEIDKKRNEGEIHFIRQGLYVGVCSKEQGKLWVSLHNIYAKKTGNGIK